MPRRPSSKILQSRWFVRVAIAILLTSGVLYLQYRLVKIPLPIDLEATNRFVLPPILLGKAQLIIKGPLVNPTEKTFISHDGRENELVNIRMDKARLSETTVTEYQGYGVKMPSATLKGKISYTTRDVDEPPGRDSKSEPCRTNFSIEASPDAKMPGEIHIFQLDSPGLESERDLEIRATGEMTVRMSAVTGENGGTQGPGCHKLLEVDAWSQKLGPALGVTAVAEANSSFRFRFSPMASNNSLWMGANGFYEALDLGIPQQHAGDPPPAIRAEAISIKAFDGRTLFDARRASDQTFVQLDRLEIGSDQLRASLSGRGLVTLNDELITLSLWDRVKDYPIIVVLLGMANTAYAAWVVRFIRNRSKVTPQS